LPIRREEKINEFCQKACRYINEGKIDKTFNDSIATELYGTVSSIPVLTDNITEGDLMELLIELIDLKSWSPKASNNMIADDIKTFFTEEMLSKKPITYIFSYRLGDAYNFPDGFQIGTGKIILYEKMVREGTTNSSELDFGNPYHEMETVVSMNEGSRNEKTGSYKKDWYMLVEVKSIGSGKAKEKASRELKDNLSLIKLFYNYGERRIPNYKFIHDVKSFFPDLSDANFSDDPYYPSDSTSYDPFDHYIHSPDDPHNAHLNFVLGQTELEYGIGFKRNPLLDSTVWSIGAIMSRRENLCDLEERILNSIQLFGLLDGSTPIEIRVVLSIFCLEGLLLTNSDRDYLGQKLAEKVSFLLVEPPDLEGKFTSSNVIQHVLPPDLASSRLKLFKKIKNLYDKRSSFAHGRRDHEDKKIGINDYEIVRSILIAVITKLATLIHQGLRSTSKGSTNNLSLDEYIEELKFKN
jgi:hypothetical protein